jgi:hypothetical protein
MINNTSLQKWNRLAQKQLDQQFVNEIRTGLQCSPFESSAILEAVYKVYAPYFETSGTLKTGQLLFPVVAIETPANTPLAQGSEIRFPKGRPPRDFSKSRIEGSGRG